jgi:SAM-dependent methyltransferase
MLTNWQLSRFILRRRDETPERQLLKIKNDAYLLRIYTNNVTILLEKSGKLNNERNKIVEIGSAGGITKLIFPQVLTTDVRSSEGVDELLNAQKMPFRDNSISAFIGKDVLHHMPDVEECLKELERTLIPGGRAVFLEPNWNIFSFFVFTFLHPEPFLPFTKNWKFESEDPMFSNQALPYILFKRDFKVAQSRFPNLKISVLESRTGLDFLLSGGVYKRNKLSDDILLRTEKFLKKIFIDKHFHLARIIALEKVN